MKISKYSLFFDIDNAEFYTYNTLSNALIEIDEDSYLYLFKAQKDKSEVSTSKIGNELYDVLTSQKFIVENDIDSFLYYKSILTHQRAGKSHMHLTMAPTMDCCFNCHYCFEKYKGKNYMSEEVMDNIIKYLNSMDNKPVLNKLTWFGGEPLMAISQMEQFYNKLIAGYKKPLSSNIITTGFHINSDALQVMKHIGISHMQITLDGLKDTHNSIKYTEGCDNVFDKVLDNIELTLKSSDIHVLFRVNLTKQNAHEYVDLYRMLKNRFKSFKKFGIAPAFVMERGVPICKKESNDLIFNQREATEFILELYHKHNIHSPFLNYPTRSFNECAIRNEVATSFDPEGYAYKCWEVIGNKEYAIGKLNECGKLTEINQIILNRHLYAADPVEDPVCSGCKYLPICHGGCPIQRIENVFEGSKNCRCTFFKGHMEEFLKIHLKLKKMKVQNNGV